VGLATEGANRHDMKLVGPTLESVPVKRPPPTPETAQNLCLDKGYDYKATTTRLRLQGYDYEEVRALLQEFGFTAHIRARGEEA